MRSCQSHVKWSGKVDGKLGLKNRYVLLVSVTLMASQQQIAEADRAENIKCRPYH